MAIAKTLAHAVWFQTSGNMKTTLPFPLSIPINMDCSQPKSNIRNGGRQSSVLKDYGEHILHPLSIILN